MTTNTDISGTTPITTTITATTRIRALGEEILGPVTAPPGSVRRRLLVARSAMAYVGLVSTLVQIVVWLAIGAITLHLDSPWWLWTAVPAAGAVAVLTVAEHWHGWFTRPSAHS